MYVNFAFFVALLRGNLDIFGGVIYRGEISNASGQVGTRPAAVPGHEGVMPVEPQCLAQKVIAHVKTIARACIPSPSCSGDINEI